MQELKNEITKLEQWSKGTESVTQMRQHCYHQALPRLQPTEKHEKTLQEFRIDDPRTCFIVNEHLWSQNRPLE